MSAGRVSRARPQGYGVTTVDGKVVNEEDTVTCCHCNAVVFLSDQQTGRPLSPDDVGGFCLRCMRNICKRCSTDGRCTPFEKKLEQAEARSRFLRAAGL